MTSVTLPLDNDICSSGQLGETADHITKLFPKCKPRSDVNLNPITLTASKHDSDSKIATMNDRDAFSNVKNRGDGPFDDGKDCGPNLYASSDDDSHDELMLQPPEAVCQAVLNANNNGGACKLRDSRIIEIAGGREIYSQSRSKATRKSRSMDNAGEDLDRKKSPFRQTVWEPRGGMRCATDNNRYQNSDEFTETVFSSEVCSMRHPRRGTPTEKDACPKRAEDRGVVVFDDIGEDWAVDGGAQPPPSVDDAVAKVIGNVPIAVYEGSPRRYGLRQADCPPPSAHTLLSSPSVYPPRPGFPQRVVDSHEVQVFITAAQFAYEVEEPSSKSTFDYLYEFSETRKVLEEFFKCPPSETQTQYDVDFQDLEYELRRQGCSGNSYVGQRLAKGLAGENECYLRVESPGKHMNNSFQVTSPKRSVVTLSGLLNGPFQDHDMLEHESNFLDLSVGTGSSGDLGETEVGLQVGHSKNFTLSPETTDCDSNCGDLDSEMSLIIMDNELSPALGLGLGSGADVAATMGQDSLRLYSSMPVLEDGLSSGHASDTDNNNPTVVSLRKRQIAELELKPPPEDSKDAYITFPSDPINLTTSPSSSTTPPGRIEPANEVEAAIKDIRLALRRTKALPFKSPPIGEAAEEAAPTPVWVPRQGGSGIDLDSSKLENGEEGPDEDEADTDLETDRLLGQQRTDDQGFYDDKGWRKPKSRTIMPPNSLNKASAPKQIVPVLSPLLSSPMQNQTPLISNNNAVDMPGPSSSRSNSPRASDGASDNSPSPMSQKGSTSSVKPKKEKEAKKKGRNKEGFCDPSVLIEGVLFRARYLGSTQLVCEGQPTKTTRMMQAEEAVSRIKAPEGESQPSTEVDLFISTEKIMVLNTDLKEIMMDHALRTISYIADIGDLVVLMARRRFVPHEMDEPPKISRTPKMICHVFESEEAQFIAQSIGQAFQVAYMEFLKANGIEDHSFVKEMDYQEVLNSQEIFGDELQMFAKKEMQKEVVVPKAKGEILGVVIVESGWGSMLPTVVIANLAPAGAAARCGQLNIGDQIIAINGVSLVGLPLSTCQSYIKNSKSQTVVKLTVVPCAPVVEVKIKRPDTKYQLGFSVQNGVICSLLRGGIAERGGVRVGHRIIEINNQSVVAVPHEKIVNLLATSVGEILMKTMPTSMFRLLTGQENPVYI